MLQLSLYVKHRSGQIVLGHYIKAPLLGHGPEVVKLTLRVLEGLKLAAGTGQLTIVVRVDRRTRLRIWLRMAGAEGRST